MSLSKLKEIENKIIEVQVKQMNEVKHGCAMPNRKNITELTKSLLEIIFPGYFTNCQNKNMGEHIACVTETTFYKFREEIGKSLRDCSLCDEENDKRADDITIEFFSKIPTVIELAHTDVEAAFVGDPAATDKSIIIATYPGIFATTIQRLAHELFLLNVPYIPRIMTEYAHSKTGIDIHPGATIGQYFFIDHGTGVVIGESTIIGEHVKIYQGVTLGAISTKDGQGLKGSKRHPTIKNHVTIYSDASVLGGDTVIDDYVTIAGNAFITKSVSKANNNKDVFDYII